MKIVTLVENSSISKYFENEHGLSLYIESDNDKILFDTGFTDIYIKNAAKLDVDIKNVDIVVISHGHYDHIGGLMHFFSINKKAKVYVHKDVFDFNFYSIRGDERKYVGPPVELKMFKERFVLIEEEHQINNLHLLTNIENKFSAPKANVLLHKRVGKKFQRDDFRHETVLVVEQSDEVIVFSGCAHNGILNTLNAVKERFKTQNIHSVFGGFHLLDKSERTSIESDMELQKVGEKLKTFNIKGKYYTGHCTGKNAFNVLSAVMGDKLTSISTGANVEI